MYAKLHIIASQLLLADFLVCISLVQWKKNINIFVGKEDKAERVKGGRHLLKIVNAW